LLGRLGKGSKMVLCGDLDQVDLPRGKESGLKFLTSIDIRGLNHVNLKKNHRNDIVIPILEKYNEYRNR